MNEIKNLYQLVLLDKLYWKRIFFSFQDGVLVDEFGLPQIPAS